MIRAALIRFLATGVLPKAPTIPPDLEQKSLTYEAFDNIRIIDRRIDETPMQKEPQNPPTESSLAPIIAPVVTRKGRHKLLQSDHSPPLRLKTSLSDGATRRNATSTTTCDITITNPTKEEKNDQSTPDPMFPTQVTTTPAYIALSQGEHRGPYLTMLQRIVDLLRKPQEFIRQQMEDSRLLENIHDFDTGGTGGEYVADDIELLWCAPPCSILHLTIPLSLVPGIVALVQTIMVIPE